MSVPLDDDSLKDVTPPRSAHNFFMDNVSYISKNNRKFREVTETKM